MILSYLDAAPDSDTERGQCRKWRPNGLVEEGLQRLLSPQVGLFAFSGAAIGRS